MDMEGVGNPFFSQLGSLVTTKRSMRISSEVAGSQVNLKITTRLSLGQILHLYFDINSLLIFLIAFRPVPVRTYVSSVTLLAM